MFLPGLSGSVPMAAEGGLQAKLSLLLTLKEFSDEG